MTPLLYPDPEPKRVPFGFNPRSTADASELAKDHRAGNAVTERAYWSARRSPYWYRGSDLTEPLEAQ